MNSTSDHRIEHVHQNHTEAIQGSIFICKKKESSSQYFIDIYMTLEHITVRATKIKKNVISHTHFTLFTLKNVIFEPTTKSNKNAVCLTRKKNNKTRKKINLWYKLISYFALSICLYL